MKRILLKSKLFAVTLTIANLFFVTAVFAQTNTWDGSSSNNWNTGSNWSLNHVPTSSEDVVININAAINVNTSPTVHSLTISNSATVSFTSSGASRTITIANTGNSIDAGSKLTLIGSTSGFTQRPMAIAFSGANRTMSIAGTLVLTSTGGNGQYIATNSLTTVTGTIQNTGGTLLQLHLI